PGEHDVEAGGLEGAVEGDLAVGRDGGARRADRAEGLGREGAHDGPLDPGAAPDVGDVLQGADPGHPSSWSKKTPSPLGATAAGATPAGAGLPKPPGATSSGRTGIGSLIGSSWSSGPSPAGADIGAALSFSRPAWT